MKKIVPVFMFLVVLFAACSKSEDTQPPAGSNFKYNSLMAADSVIQVNGVTTVTANATGDGLSYKWTATYGTFIGSGSQVQWTVCHQSNFTITCQVTDKYNHSESKSVIVKARN